MKGSAENKLEQTNIAPQIGVCAVLDEQLGNRKGAVAASANQGGLVALESTKQN
jgi:hypothetical protein